MPPPDSLQCSTREYSSTAITLRPLGTSDESFLYELFVATRAREWRMADFPPQLLEQTLRLQYTAWMQAQSPEDPHKVHRIILRGQEAVGAIFWSRVGSALHLTWIAVMPALQRCGIGSTAIRYLQGLVANDGTPLRLHCNRLGSVADFYQRHGFRVVGGNDTDLLMEWMPPAWPVSPQDSFTPTNNNNSKET